MYLPGIYKTKDYIIMAKKIEMTVCIVDTVVIDYIFNIQTEEDSSTFLSFIHGLTNVFKTGKIVKGSLVK